MIIRYFILFLALCQCITVNSQTGKKAKWIPGTAPGDSIIVPSGLLVNPAGVRYALLTDIAAYVGSETDPVFAASAAAAVTGGSIANWNTAYGWGNHAIAGYVSTAGSYGNPAWLTSLDHSKITYSGTTAQYVRGDGSFASFPVNLSSFVNDLATHTAARGIGNTGNYNGSTARTWWIDTTGIYQWTNRQAFSKIIVNNGITDNGLGVLQVTGDIWTSGSITLKSASFTGGLTISHSANGTVAMSNAAIGVFMTAGPGNYVTFPQNYISVKGIINGNSGAFPWYFGASNANGMSWDAANSINNSGGNNNYYMAFTVSPNMQQANTIYDLIRFSSTITFNANSSGTTKVRGIYFNPTVSNGSALPTGQIVIPFENVLGNNYFNSSSGNTGFGYASGAALSEKLSVSGNVVATYFIGSMQPTSMADGAAPNNTVYYSTTQSKLVYKDAGGVVNVLY